MYINSNLSPREAFRIHGNLPTDMIEQLITESEYAEESQSVVPSIYEAKAQFLGEDFAQDIIDELEFFVKRLRGDNRKELQEIILKLADLQIEITRSSEYGRNELVDALKVLEVD